MSAQLPVVELSRRGASPVIPAPARAMKVALINMPWAAADRPSIQCGLLKTALVRHGHDVTVLNLNLDLAARLGPDRYELIAGLPSERTHMLGDWLFTTSAFGPQVSDEAYVDALPGVDKACEELGLPWAEVIDLRGQRIPQWIDDALGAVDWTAYDVVGLTSTFEQNVASIAAANVIKRRAPRTVVVLGGANVDGSMGAEYLRHFTSIDYTVTGEADESFPRLVAALSHGQAGTDIPGICRRRGDGTVTSRPPVTVAALDKLGAADFTDYFTDLYASASPKRARGTLRKPTTISVSRADIALPVRR